ncbi:hypothetical protein EHS25_009618 [Saitozyma podzolica]|uniref:SIS domain-containing protein n=1 Tax=Saitozyma podzolica TaxID=1890683 RepID=A0A427YJS3_9TREE|nr:hypothetical protein EHS25_009618 [Saitozyma podzolica]
MTTSTSLPGADQPNKIDLSTLQTESRNPRTTELDVVSTLDMCRMFNHEDMLVPMAVSQHLEAIARIIDRLTERVRRGGRVVYLGAGTSGRLGVLDASEIPPTYSADPSLFVGLIAGGDHALRHPVEGAEDSREDCIGTLRSLSPPVGPEDSVIGIASSGRTPWVLGGVEYAKSIGCFTAGIACASPSALRTEGNCEEVVECVVGGEVVTGSTRMKAGTATKLILNMISSGVMIRIGKTFGNLMVDVRTSNDKLVVRARGILRSILDSLPSTTDLALVSAGKLDLEDDAAVSELIERCGGVKVAAVVLRQSQPITRLRGLSKLHIVAFASAIPFALIIIALLSRLSLFSAAKSPSAHTRAFTGVGMAWFCSGRSNDELITRLRHEGLIHSDRVADAMRKVDRAHYVPETGAAYEDSPQRIGFGATISAPHMHAHATENLLPLFPSADKQHCAVLDVGSGSGYLAAVFHYLAPHSQVVGIEHLQELVDLGKHNLEKDKVPVGHGPGKVNVVLGDGRKGWPESAPYQVIHVGAAAPHIPQELIDQLDSPGRMFIPVGVGHQDIYQVDKSATGEITKKKLFGVMYVPLTDPDKQWSG